MAAACFFACLFISVPFLALIFWSWHEGRFNFLTTLGVPLIGLATASWFVRKPLVLQTLVSVICMGLAVVTATNFFILDLGEVDGYHLLPRSEIEIQERYQATSSVAAEKATGVFSRAESYFRSTEPPQKSHSEFGGPGAYRVPVDYTGNDWEAGRIRWQIWGSWVKASQKWRDMGRKEASRVRGILLDSQEREQDLLAAIARSPWRQLPGFVWSTMPMVVGISLALMLFNLFVHALSSLRRWLLMPRRRYA